MSIIHEKHYLYPEHILIRKFIGKTSGKDIVDSWEYLHKNNLINKKIKGVINDLSDCELIMDMEKFKTLLNFMKNQDYLKNIKLAVISDNPEIIVFPFLGKEQERTLKIKPFSTMEAAVNWIAIDIS